MAIAAEHDQFGSAVARLIEQRRGDAVRPGGHIAHLRPHPMSGEMQPDVGAGLVVLRLRPVVVDRDDPDLRRRAQQRQGVMHGPRRLARRRPGDEDALRRPPDLRRLGHDDDRTAGIEQGGIEGAALRVAAAALVEADHGQIEIAAELGETRRRIAAFDIGAAKFGLWSDPRDIRPQRLLERISLLLGLGARRKPGLDAGLAVHRDRMEGEDGEHEGRRPAAAGGRERTGVVERVCRSLGPVQGNKHILQQRRGPVVSTDARMVSAVLIVALLAQGLGGPVMRGRMARRIRRRLEMPQGGRQASPVDGRLFSRRKPSTVASSPPRRIVQPRMSKARA